MKTKYFRFLYFSGKSCLVHFGELKDTWTGEIITFLYIRGAKTVIDEQIPENALFLCPKRVNLIVVGNEGEISENLLKGLSGRVYADLMFLPKGSYNWSLDYAEIAESVRWMRPGCSQDAVTFVFAGWRFFIKSYREGVVTLAHGLEDGLDREGLPESEETDEVKGSLFEDCVMNVKALDGKRMCECEETTDGYACAMGCARNKDFDICRNHKGGNYLTGTLLAGNRLCMDGIEKDLCHWIEKMRFFDRMAGAERIGESEGNKRYYIGLKEDMDDGEAEKICRSGQYQIPVLLASGKGICCSGLLKYREKI